MRVGPFLYKMGGGYQHWCPGCGEAHFIAVEKPLKNGARWTFNGDLERPTFSPSILIRIDHGWVADPKEDRSVRCHYFIGSGKIQFCGDSTHALSGKTVPLPLFPDDY